MDSLLSRDTHGRFVCESDRAVQTVIDAIYTAKLGDDVVYAYMAETYPLNHDAAHWRRFSGTRNGVYTAFFLNTIARWDNWIVEAARELPGRTLSPLQRVLIAWINGTLPVKIRARSQEIAQAAELRLMPGITQGMAQEDVIN
ncbi:MAG: hypothetical protein WC654_01180 [Patescibacteria group bacterium]